MDNPTSTLLPKHVNVHLNFEWLAFWLKIAGAWHYTHLSRTSTVLLIIYYIAGIAVQSIWAIVVLVNHYHELHNPMIDMVASQFQTTDIIIIRIIEGFLMQIMRALAIYYFWNVAKTNTWESLSFSINRITSHNPIAIWHSQSLYSNGKPIKRPKIRNYGKYPQRLHLFLALLLIAYVIRKIVYAYGVLHQFTKDKQSFNVYDNFSTISGATWYCVFEIALFTLLVVTPYVANLIYIVIFTFSFNFLYLKN